VLQAVILTNEEKIILTPTYHVMEMYNVHQDATLLPVSIKTADYVFENDKLQAVSVSASIDKDGMTHVSLVNIDSRNAQEVTIEFFGKKYSSVSSRILNSAKLQDFNSFENPSKVQPKPFTEARLKDNIISVKVPPFSVIVLELK
jgi:alpha-N-arabinofuranosidase